MPNKPLSLATGEELIGAFGGHGSPRKSKPTVGMLSGEPDPIRWLTRVTLKKQLAIATINKRKRNLALARKKRYSQSQFKPCLRRWLEFGSLGRFSNLKKFAYTVKPKLLERPERFYYELSLCAGLMPILCFTDGGEAYETCQALRANGYESAEIKQFDLSEQHPPKESDNVF